LPYASDVAPPPTLLNTRQSHTTNYSVITTVHARRRHVASNRGSVEESCNNNSATKYEGKSAAVLLLLRHGVKTPAQRAAPRVTRTRRALFINTLNSSRNEQRHTARRQRSERTQRRCSALYGERKAGSVGRRYSAVRRRPPLSAHATARCGAACALSALQLRGVTVKRYSGATRGIRRRMAGACSGRRHSGSGT